MGCAIIGIHGEKNVSRELFYGLKSLRHRGHSSVGMLMCDGTNIFPVKSYGYVENLLSEEELKTVEEDYPGFVGIGHNRYSTTGKDDPKSLEHNAQPEYIINPFLAGAHNGNIYNGSEILPKISRKPRTDCDIQLLLLSFAENIDKRINEESLIEAGERVMSTVKGAYSALFLTMNKKEQYLFAMTDPYKVRPLVLGRKDNEWCLASETRAFKRLGFEYVKDVEGGTILFVDPRENEPFEKQLIRKPKHHCMFEWIYYAQRDSVIEGRSVNEIRRNIGRALAKECPAEADIVVPNPKSGYEYAVGFAMESGIPFEFASIKDEDIRSFIIQTQEQRDKITEENVHVIEEAVKGKRVVVTDDTQIRGTTSKKTTRKYRNAGAREVHMRFGCTEHVAPCYLGIDMRSRGEFIALDKNGEKKSWEKIAEEIGADSVGYISMKTLKSIIIGNKDFNICTGCLDFPDGYPPDMRKDVIELIKRDISGKRAYEA